MRQLRTRDKLRDLYEGVSPRAHAFRDGLFVFDISAIVYVIISSFLPESQTIEWINRVFGVLVLTDIAARITISRRPVRELIRPLKCWLQFPSCGRLVAAHFCAR